MAIVVPTTRIFTSPMRYASMMAKVQATAHGSDGPTSGEIYHAATVGGAKALGLQRRWGKSGTGSRPTSSLSGSYSGRPGCQHNSTVAQIVQAEDGTSVRHVMVGGRMLVRDREIADRRSCGTIEKGRKRTPKSSTRHSVPPGDLLARLNDVVDRLPALHWRTNLILCDDIFAKLKTTLRHFDRCPLRLVGPAQVRSST